MAIVKNMLLGDLRGNLGPLTFSANQFGTHVFIGNRTKPPASDAQSAHRTLFGTNPLPYSTLDPTVKANWKSFAKTVYNNPRKPPGSTATAYSCFSACIKTLQSLQPAFFKFTLDWPTYGFQNVSALGFPGYPLEAPVKQIVPFIAGTGFVLVGISFAMCQLSTLGPSDFRFSLANGLTPPWNSNILEDPNKQWFGIAIYASKRMKVATQPYGNPFKTLLFWSGFVNLPAGTLDTDKVIQLHVDFPHVVMSKLKFYKGNDYFAITPLLIDTYGNACRCETIVTLVTELT